MIRIDAAWLNVEPLDMRAGPDNALVRVFGDARPHYAHFFVNRRATRLEVLVHGGFGCRAPAVWDIVANAPRNGRCRMHGGLMYGS